MLPARKDVRVRGIQTHGKTATEAKLGDRAALNLTNIAKDEIQRGDVLATAGQFTPTVLFDVKLSLLTSAKKPLANRTRIRLHIGTREILARVKLLDRDQLEPGDAAIAQVRLEQSAVAMRRDPFVIRQYSPTITIGGGIILDVNPKPHRRYHQETLRHLANMEKQDPLEMLTSLLLSRHGAEMSIDDLIKGSGLAADQLRNHLDQLVQQEQIIQFGSRNKPLFFHKINYARLQERIIETLRAFHNKEPLRPGMSKAELKSQATEGASHQLSELALGNLIQNDIIEEQPQWVKLAEHRIQLSSKDEEIGESISAILLQNKYATPSPDELARQIGKPFAEVQRVLGALQGMGTILRLEGDIFFHAEAVKEAKQQLLDWMQARKEISVSQFRELLNTSRKYAMALLQHFDQVQFTERVGDVRYLKSS